MLFGSLRLTYPLPHNHNFPLINITKHIKPMENYVKSLEVNASIRTTLGTPMDTKDIYVYLYRLPNV